MGWKGKKTKKIERKGQMERSITWGLRPVVSNVNGSCGCRIWLFSTIIDTPYNTINSMIEVPDARRLQVLTFWIEWGRTYGSAGAGFTTFSRYVALYWYTARRLAVAHPVVPADYTSQTAVNCLWRSYDHCKYCVTFEYILYVVGSAIGIRGREIPLCNLNQLVTKNTSAFRLKIGNNPPFCEPRPTAVAIPPV